MHANHQATGDSDYCCGVVFSHITYTSIFLVFNNKHVLVVLDVDGYKYNGFDVRSTQQW